MVGLIKRLKRLWYLSGIDYEKIPQYRVKKGTVVNEPGVIVPLDITNPVEIFDENEKLHTL